MRNFIMWLLQATQSLIGRFPCKSQNLGASGCLCQLDHSGDCKAFGIDTLATAERLAITTEEEAPSADVVVPTMLRSEPVNSLRNIEPFRPFRSEERRVGKVST